MRKRKKEMAVFKIIEEPDEIDSNDQEPIIAQLEAVKSEVIKLGKSQLQSRTFAKTEYQALKDAISNISGKDNEIIETVINELLAIADGLESGIRSGMMLSIPEADSWIEGMDMVYQRAMDLLEKLEIQPIQALGKEFDPFLHKAVAIESKPEIGNNIIIEEQRRGYMRNGKVIRHSEVVINSFLDEFLKQEEEINE